MNLDEYFSKSMSLKETGSNELIVNEIDEDVISIGRLQKQSINLIYVRNQIGKAIHHKSGIDFSFIFETIPKTMLETIVRNYDKNIVINQTELNKDDYRCFSHYVVGDLLINDKKFMSSVMNSFVFNGVKMNLIVGHVKHTQNDFDEPYSVYGSKEEIYKLIGYLYDSLSTKKLENLSS